MSNITDGSTDIERVRSRRKDIEREIKNAKLRISALASEDQELEIAERVILRLYGNHAHSILPALRQEAHFVVGAPREEEITSKPSDTPTMPKMIVEALEFAKIQGKSGLEPKAITAYIANKWWPEVSMNNVSPIAWRMMKRGQLVKPSKRDAVYSLPNNEAPDVVASGASGDEGGASSSIEDQETNLGRTSGAEPADPGP